jgi:glycosyltransferase involved in cell wall biosynthesis
MKPVVGLDVSALDSTFKAHAGRGIGRYVRELHRYLQGYQSDRIAVDTFDHQTCRLPSVIEQGLSMIPVGRQTIRQQMVYPVQLGSGPMSRFSALHFPAHMDAPAWTWKPYILTVLDLIPLVLAELYAADVPGWRFRFARYLELRAIRGASLILAISECTARDLERVLGIPPERIRVTPLGVDESFFAHVTEQARERAWEVVGLPREATILLYVGGIDPRKNVLGLVRMFDELLAARRSSGHGLPHLVIAGRIEEDRGYPGLCGEIRRRGLEDFIHLVGYVADDVLKGLYQISTIFVFPSRYEGFGLPPLEAMAAGLPVVSSRAASLPEVLGEVGIGVEPDDTGGWVAEIGALLDDPERRERLSREGTVQARHFSWVRTGETTAAAYEEFCQERFAWRSSQVPA